MDRITWTCTLKLRLLRFPHTSILLVLMCGILQRLRGFDLWSPLKSKYLLWLLSRTLTKSQDISHGDYTFSDRSFFSILMPPDSPPITFKAHSLLWNKVRTSCWADAHVGDAIWSVPQPELSGNGRTVLPDSSPTWYGVRATFIPSWWATRPHATVACTLPRCAWCSMSLIASRFWTLWSATWVYRWNCSCTRACRSSCRCWTRRTWQCTVSAHWFKTTVADTAA